MIARHRENSEHVKDKPRSRSNPNHDSKRRHISEDREGNAASKTIRNLWNLDDQPWQGQLEIAIEKPTVWASYQIRKIVSCACTGNAGNVFLATMGLRSRHASRHVRDARAVMHAGIASYRFPLKSVAGKTFPAFPAHAQPAILRIWQEAHARRPSRETLLTRWNREDNSDHFCMSFTGCLANVFYFNVNDK